MQINGLEQEYGHKQELHQVTGCVHEHHQTKEETGGGAAVDSLTLSSKLLENQKQEQEAFSWTGQLQKLREKLRGFWGSGTGSSTTGSSTTGDGTGNEKHSMTQSLEVATAAAAVQPPHSIEKNPYFIAVDSTETPKQKLLQKLRVQVKDAAGRLNNKLFGRFAGFQAKNSFHTKQEKSKEDLRKRSRYREDSLEIDCVLTEDSYLMDSYDRKGEYSTLSAKK